MTNLPPENKPQPNNQGLFHNPAAIEELRHHNRLVENNYYLMDEIEEEMGGDLSAPASEAVGRLDQFLDGAVRVDPEGAAELGSPLADSADEYDRILAGKLLLTPLDIALESSEKPWAGIEANLNVLARVIDNESSAIARRWFNTALFAQSRISKPSSVLTYCRMRSFYGSTFGRMKVSSHPESAIASSRIANCLISPGRAFLPLLLLDLPQ
jgi:hypothetical protein